MDYKDTVFLPKTEFSMRGGLAQKEPEMLAFWKKIDLYKQVRKQSKGRQKFILHDGPPYANGHIHAGHAVNKILKDVVIRFKQMLGFDAPYIPGWDCHGLPIEWKIEEQYREKNKNKDEVPVIKFRDECREFAKHWMSIQSGEFQRLGVLGDWEHTYTTMTNEAEAQIVAEIHKFLLNGSLYRGSKPVMWSTVEKTALAEAEVEYKDVVSPTVWIKFPIVRTHDKALEGASVVIWTTTPWTLPGNRAVAYGPSLEYVLVEVAEAEESSLAKVGDKLLLAKNLVVDTEAAAKCKFKHLHWSSKGELGGIVCAHPLRGHGYDFDVPLLPADFVEHDQGTGFVHIAPGHGSDDFNLGRKYNLEIPETVSDDGSYYPTVPLFGEKKVYTHQGKHGDATGAVLEAIQKAGHLLAQGKITHSYPHSWRSKTPLIFRTTPQWFIAMDDKNELRSKALAAIAEIKWYPERGQTRISSMVETRPDWCISRQRSWGVPIAIFVDKRTGETLKDKKVLERIVAAFRKEGSDAWFTHSAKDFLGKEYEVDDYIQVRDIVDVWFESGATHTFVIENNKDLAWPADLYLESTDQHRGWFQSSLLESCGTRGKASYKACLTYGMTLDDKGYKMSKSLGNIVPPHKITDVHGADVLRLWAVGSDYFEDMRVGDEIIKRHSDVYRRLRNTLRYMLGALDGFSEKEHVKLKEMPELERWVLHKLWEMDAEIHKRVESYDFHDLFTILHNFCTSDLSAFYFDIRKDCLYCDAPNSIKRRAVRTVMDILFYCLTAWFAPVLCFTAEEAWQTRKAAGTLPSWAPESVHLRQLPAIPVEWRNDALAEKWSKIREVRDVVTAALEKAREAKTIGSSLQAHVDVHVSDEYEEFVDEDLLKEVAIVSSAEVLPTPELDVEPNDKVQQLRLLAPKDAFRLGNIEGVAVVVKTAPGAKCERCWQVLEEVKTGLCERCREVVGEV